MTSRVVETEEDLRQALAVEDRLAAAASGLSISDYLEHIVINSAPVPRRFRDVREPWQTEIWSEMDRALESVAFGGRWDGPHGFWVTMPRGHDKTSSIGRRVNWLLSWSKRRLMVTTAAADLEQAGLLTECMEREIRLNPWIPVKIFRKTAAGPSGKLKVLSSDAPTTWGLNADVYIIDELTWWRKQDLWEPLLTAFRKRPGGLFIIITNAGVTGTWQHALYETLAGHPDWKILGLPPYTWAASWMDRTKIEEDRRCLPAGVAKRVFDNVWIDPAEESGFLTRTEIESCSQLGRELGLRPASTGQGHIDYVAAVDYGPKRDRTALVVGHHDAARRIVVDLFDLWQGSPDQPVLVARVREWLLDVSRRFHNPLIVVDPYQLEGLIQELEYHQRIVRFEARGGKSNYEMASTLRSLIANRQLVWYPGAGDLVLPNGRVETIADELAALVIKPTPYGYRFDHTAAFHDDRAVALGMMALYAARNPPAPVFTPPPVLTPPSRNIAMFETGEACSRRPMFGIMS